MMKSTRNLDTTGMNDVTSSGPIENHHTQETTSSNSGGINSNNEAMSMTSTPEWGDDDVNNNTHDERTAAGSSTSVSSDIELTGTSASFIDEHVDDGVGASNGSPHHNDRDGLLRASMGDPPPPVTWNDAKYDLSMRHPNEYNELIHTPHTIMMMKKEQRRKRHWRWVSLVLLILGIGGLIGAALRMNNNNDNSSSSSSSSSFDGRNGVPTPAPVNGNAHSESPVHSVGLPMFPSAPPVPTTPQTGNTERPVHEVGLSPTTHNGGGIGVPTPAPVQATGPGTENPVHEVGLPTFPTTPPVPTTPQTGNTERPVHEVGDGVGTPGRTNTEHPAGTAPIMGGPTATRTLSPQRIPEVPATPRPTDPFTTDSPTDYPTFRGDDMGRETQPVFVTPSTPTGGRTLSPQRIPEVPATPRPTDPPATSSPTDYPTNAGINPSTPTGLGGGDVPTIPKDLFTPTEDNGPIISAEWTKLGNSLNGMDSDDGFGSSVALSSDGRTVAVGASRYGDLSGINIGYTQIYAYNTQDWSSIAGSLEGDGPESEYGRDVALSANGHVVAISGIGYVDSFVLRNNNSWVKWASRIDGSEGFGTSISMSNDGHVLAVGDPSQQQLIVYELLEDPNLSTLEWSTLGNIIDFYETDESRYGRVVQVAGDGNHVVGGYRTSRDGTQYLRVFALSQMRDQWERLGNSDVQIPIQTVMAASQVTPTISDNGLVLAVGVSSTSGGGSMNSLSVYDYSNGVWVPRGATLVGGTGDIDFGKVVALSSSGNTVATSSSVFHNTEGISHARVYQWHGEVQEWIPIDPTPENSSTRTNEYHDIALSSDGRTVVVSTRINTAGYAQVYSLST